MLLLYNNCEKRKRCIELKNYAENAEEKETFILNYDDTSDESNISLNLASGEKHLIPKTDRNLEIIESKMEEQVADARSTSRETMAQISYHRTWGIILSVATFIILLDFNRNVDITTLPQLLVSILFHGMTFAGLGVPGIRMLYLAHKNSSKIKDIKKHELFMKNRNILNSPDMLNEYTLQKTSAKTRKVIEKQTEENKAPFTFNSLDKISYNDLNQIMNNIKLNKNLGIDLADPSNLDTLGRSNPKKKVRSRTR